MKNFQFLPLSFKIMGKHLFFMLFYVFLLFIYPPNMVFLMISGATQDRIPKSGIWLTSPAYGLEIMLLIKKAGFARDATKMDLISVQ